MAIELVGEGPRAPKTDLIPVVTVESARRGTRTFERHAAKTDDAGVLVVFEVEPLRDVDGDITNWRPLSKGVSRAIPPGEWNEAHSAWKEVERV